MPAIPLRGPFGLALVITALAGGSLDAQQQLDATLMVGTYTSFGTLIDAAVPERDSRRQVGTGMLGAGLAVWRTSVGLEATAAFSPGFVATTTSLSTRDLSSRVMFGSVRAAARVPLGADGLSVRGAVGAGVIHRRGVAWHDVEGTTDAALVVSLGGRMALPETRAVITLGIDDYVTRAGFRLADGRETDPRPHHDVLWSFGVTVPLAR